MKNLILFLFLTFPALAQQNYLLKGIVLDSLENEPLPGATVLLNYGDQSKITGADGRFEFLIPSNEVTVVVRFVGYVSFRKTLKLPEDKLIVPLSKVANQLQEVVVNGLGSETVKRPLLGVSTLSVKTIEKLPTALGEVDVLKGLQMLPGISSVGEASNGVNVRGGTTDQNLFLLDDGPIFNPTHMFGLFSAFPSEAVSSFDLYKGNVPVRYGGRAAGVLDVKLSNPDLNTFKFEGGISLVSNKLKMDIPLIKNKMGIMLAGRASFNDFLFPIISDQLQDLKAKFGDGAAKWFYQVNSKNTLTLTGYYSYDFFQTELLGSINNINADATQFEYSTANLTGKWFHSFGKNANMQSTFVKSLYKPNNLLPERNSDNVVKIKQEIDYTQFKSNLNLYKGIHTLELGVDAIRYGINPGALDPGSSESVNAINTPLEYGLETAIGAEDLIEFNNKLSMTLGLRYSQFFNLGPSDVRIYEANAPRNESSVSEVNSYAKNEVSQSYGGIEPRVGLRYSLGRYSSIKAGYNLARQYLQIVSNTTTPVPTSRWKLSDATIKPQVSQLYSLGFFQDTPGSVYEFSTELYYRNTQNIIDYKDGADFLLNKTPETEILQGLNKSYGAEFMFSKKKGEITGWLNYTYARSLNLVNEGPLRQQQVNFGEWYASNYDRPHTINASLILNQGKHHDFSFVFTYSTGRPFTSPQGFITYANQVLPFYFFRNDIRLPDYHRLDFAWNIYNPRLKDKKFKGNFAFSVYNLYGRKNAYSIFFKSEGNNLNPYRLTVFGAPIVSLAYKFTFNH